MRLFSFFFLASVLLFLPYTNGATCVGFAGCSGGANHLKSSPGDTTCASDTCQTSECCHANPTCNDIHGASGTGGWRIGGFDVSCDTACTSNSMTCVETDFRNNINDVASESLMSSVLSALGFDCTSYNHNFGKNSAVPVLVGGVNGDCAVSKSSAERDLSTFDCARVASPLGNEKKRLCWCSAPQVAYSSSSCVGGVNFLKDDLSVVCTTATCQASDCCKSCSGFAGCASGTNHLKSSPGDTTCASDTCQTSECCETCTNQANCAVSTANTCSTTASFTTNTICTSVTADGYYLDGEVVRACAVVSGSSGRTCTTFYTELSPK